MSIEQALADNTASNVALATALAANTAVMEKLLAGRDSAVAALEAKAEGKPTRSSRKPKEDAAAGNGSDGNAATGSQEAGATAASEPTGPSDDDLRAAATTYIQGAGDDKEARSKRAASIKSITDHFGTKTLVGETGITDPTQRVQALFYLKRFTAGSTVDFNAEYDFAGDPAQGGAAEADDFDAIG